MVKRVAVRRGTAWTPTDLGGCLLWLDASYGLYQDAAGTTPAVLDTDPVGMWQDRSGNAHNATQSTDNARPALKLTIVNGLPVLRFDGSDDCLTLGNPATLQMFDGSIGTIFILYLSSNNNKRQCLLGQEGTAGTMHIEFTTYTDGRHYRRIGAPGGGTIIDTHVTAVGATPYNAWELLAYSRSGTGIGTHMPWRNENLLNINNENAIDIAGHGDKYIGRYSSENYLFQGDIATIIYYNRVLSVAEMNQVHDYLYARYAYTLPEAYLWASEPDLSIIWVPDTQAIPVRLPTHAQVIFQWLKRRQANLKIAAVLSHGDMVGTGTTEAEWTNIGDGYTHLDTAGIPYLPCLGNHDYDDAGARTTTHFDAEFPVSRLTARSGWSGGFYDAGSAANSYMLLTAGGVDYLLISVEYGPRQAVVDWVNTLCTTYSTRDVIIATHSFLEHDDTRTTTGDMYNPHTAMGAHPACHDGEEFWQECVKLQSNIVWVGSGHTFSGQDFVGYLASAGDNANTVHQHMVSHLIDYTGDSLGDNRYFFRIWEKTGNTIQCYTYSPIAGYGLVDAANEFAVTYKP